MKISTWQLFWMFTTLEISMSIWLTISPTIEIAKQDAWISFAVAGLIGLVVTMILVRVSQRHASHTLVEFAQKLFGKWVGKANKSVVYCGMVFRMCRYITNIFIIY